MTYSELKTRILSLTTSSLTDANLTIMLKVAANRVTSLIQNADGRWEYDDPNNTDAPIATAAIVTSQQDYQVSTTHLQVRRVEIKYTDGNWTQLQPYDNADYDGQSITQLATQTGIPRQYDLLGGSIYLWPVPNYSQTASLKVYYERAQKDFDYTTGMFTDSTGSTASVPGFNPLYHDLLAYLVAYDYAIINLPSQLDGYSNRVNQLEDSLKRDYAKRDKDDPAQITTRMIKHR